MNNIFGNNGILATHLEDYEARPGQAEMAEAVTDLLSDALSENESLFKDQADCLVVEAETGLGKTLAYLVPAVLSGRKTVISTNTRNLQDQILESEIPFIKRFIDPDLKAICVKGRQNYLCLYRYHQYRSEEQASLFQDDTIDELDQWVGETTYGDRAELSWSTADNHLWQKICCQSHFCLGSECPDGPLCFLNRLRRDAAASRLIIVNHHLLFSDLAVRRTGYGEVLPRYEAVVFDEAHHIENVASTFFGHSFSKYQTRDLVGDIERSAAEGCSGARKESILSKSSLLAAAMEALSQLFPMEKGRFPLDRILADNPAITTAASTLHDAIIRLGESLEPYGGSDEPWEQYANRCHDLAARLALITTEFDDDFPVEELRYTYWFERTDRNLSLFATPVNVAPELQSTLYASTAACVFTSATLSTGGDFKYFLKRLGLPEQTPTLSFPSPFDYKKRTLLYIPETGFPEPSSPAHQQAVHDEIEKLVTLSKGRALLLFTSFKAMESAFEALKEKRGKRGEKLPYPMMIQGEAPRKTLLKRFSEQTHSILFAVSSFWEGVDIQGEALSLLVIDKLPFEVPSDPVIMARINRIKQNGGNPFFDFQVPRAILSLRQGVGRLMRCSNDRGVIAILDIRLFTKGYGRRFLKSLPASPLTRTPRQVADFFLNDNGTT